MREKDIEAYFRDAVRVAGGVSYKFKSVNHRGVSDRIVCLPDGQTWFVELKRPGGKLSPLQSIFRKEMIDLRQKYALLSSKADVDFWLKTVGGGAVVGELG